MNLFIIMSEFVLAMSSNTTEVPIASTWNGAVSLATSGENLTNLYYRSVRGLNKTSYIELLNNAWTSDHLLTLRLIAYIRNIRSGKGERDLGRWGLEWLAAKSPLNFKQNLKHYLGTFGRWDDACSLDVDEVSKTVIYQTIAEQLLSDSVSEHSISVCAKWVPSEGKKIDQLNSFNSNLAKHMGLSRGELRKILSSLRQKLNLLETKLAEKKISEISYSQVPSVAMMRHSRPSKAFQRLDKERFDAYKAALTKGEAKVNVGTLYPYQIVDQYLSSINKFVKVEQDELLESQWLTMLEKLSEAERKYLSRSLCIVDTSGSMYSSDNPRPISIAISLGLMISEMCPNSSFKNTILTFSSEPTFYRIEGNSLCERVCSLKMARWGMTTDFEKTYRLILERALEFKLTQEQMPNTLIVISDMQFNQASSNMTNFELMKREFGKNGYNLPNLVFWNVNGKTTDCPVTASESNTALISGFSIDILRDVLSGQPITPFSVMMRTLNREEYNIITLSE